MSPQWTFARRSGPGVWPAGQTPGPERQQRDGTFGFCCFDWEMAYRCLGAPFWSETLCHPTGPSPWLVSWIRFEKLMRSCFKQNYSEANDCRLCNSLRWMLTPDSEVGTEDWINNKLFSDCSCLNSGKAIWPNPCPFTSLALEDLGPLMASFSLAGHL